MVKSFITNGSNFTVCEACVIQGRRENTTAPVAEGAPFLCDFCGKLYVVFEGRTPEKKLDSAGWDLFADKDATLYVNKTVIVGTGLRMALPKNWEAQIRARSGLASKGIIVANSPGTIDYNYREEIGVILLNHSPSVYEIKAGDRIAQMLFASIPNVEWTRGSLQATERKGGFGSTGSTGS